MSLSLHKLTTLLKTASSQSQALQLHAILSTSGLLPNALLHTQLINLYAKIKSFSHSFLTFNSVKHHSNVITWTSIISHLSCSRRSTTDSIRLFVELVRSEIRPNAFSLSAVLPSVANNEFIYFGSQVHGLACKLCIENDVFVGSALTDMYAKCGNMGDANKVFDEMPVRNLVSWNSVIVGFMKNEMYEKAIGLFRELLLEKFLCPDEVSFSSVLSSCGNVTDGLGLGKQVHARVVKQHSDSVAYVRNSLIDMYSKCGCFREAHMLFDRARDRDVVTWNIIMMGWVHCHWFEEACSCFLDLTRESIQPDEASFSTILHAVASLAKQSLGAAIHDQAIKTGFMKNRCVCNSLIVMYSKCGNLNDAHQVFQDGRDYLNVVSWTAMITAFQQHGHGKFVITLFEEMLEVGFKPDYITLVSVLAACSHNGLIEQGLSYLNKMSQEYGLKPGYEHYACVVDMLGRAKRLDEAKIFINTMPIKPDASVWGALLAACRNCGDLEMGSIAAAKLFEIEPHNPGNYVLLANMYTNQGMLEEANNIRRIMKSKGISKETGCSWIDVKDKTLIFTVHDRSHDRTEEIYKKLREIQELVKKKGYMADTKFAVNDIGEYKEQNLWYHSERLALAFGLISLPENAPLIIKKNLRTCGDCHAVMKFASEIYKREIVLRDINRFHRFAEGSCACGDYW